MKNLIVFILIPLFLGYSLRTNAQTRPNVTVSVGHPDLYQIGFYVPADQCRIGMAYGWMNNDSRSLTASVFYHFGGKINGSGFKPFYVHNAINIFSNRFYNEYFLDFQLLLRGGYLWSPGRIGLFVEAGPLFPINDSLQDPGEKDNPVLLALSAGLFIRL